MREAKTATNPGARPGGCCRRHCRTDLGLPRLHVVAIALARSVALRRHEMASVPANMIGRVEIQDKSDLLWDPPELYNLCVRPESEHELRERNTVPERKRALTPHAAETAPNLLHNRRLLRVEWYIVVLIVVDIALYTHEIRLKR